MNKLQQEKRDRFLKNLIKESIINVIAEQALQAPQSPELPEQQPASSDTNTPPQASPPSEPIQNNAPNEVQPFDVDVLIDKLNILRGSKSYTDPEIYGKLTTFVKSLTEEQSKSIQWLLEELTKIVADIENLSTPENNVQEPPPPPPSKPEPAPAPPAPTPSVSPAAEVPITPAKV